MAARLGAGQIGSMQEKVKKLSIDICKKSTYFFEKEPLFFHPTNKGNIKVRI